RHRTDTDLSVAARKQLVEALRTCDVQVDVDALVKALDDNGGGGWSRPCPALHGSGGIRTET
ncbi:MAG TPA: hypothetical protein DCE39_00715, partial [Planctomycetaceae bacterium]|nr:hypothetical protein [Planctomycetaceae bacterium]